MKKLVLFCLVFALLFSYTIQGMHADRTLTKAICVENVCQDYLVYCLEDIIVEIQPISAFVIFGENWEDKRTEKELCA